MPKYKVHLKFIYGDIVHVEAETEKEAVQKALLECQEMYECFYDADVEESEE